MQKLAKGATLETLWERARAQAEPCSLALVLHALHLGLFMQLLYLEASLVII